MHTLIIGAGFSGLQIAKQARALGSVCGTRRSPQGLLSLEQIGVQALQLSGVEQGSASDAKRSPVSPDFHSQLNDVTHLVICTAPDRKAPFDDSVLRLFRHESIRMPKLEWMGYLSTIGVYGDHNGDWVDESTPCTSVQTRSLMRREAEIAWSNLADQYAVPVSTLRLSGIYGPGRNAVQDAMAGRDRVLTRPGQVFNRIHVADLATATLKAAVQRYHGIINISDDLPAAPEQVVAYAHSLVGKPCPPEVDVSTADISEMARSFYSENKRVSNALSKQVLGMHYEYPTYREGLSSIPLTSFAG